MSAGSSLGVEPRLTRLLKWSWDFAPTWMGWFFDHGLMRLIADVRCLAHGHEGYVGMDGRSIVCLWCHTTFSGFVRDTR